MHGWMVEDDTHSQSPTPKSQPEPEPEPEPEQPRFPARVLPIPQVGSYGR